VSVFHLLTVFYSSNLSLPLHSLDSVCSCLLGFICCSYLSLFLHSPGSEWPLPVHSLFLFWAVSPSELFREQVSFSLLISFTVITCLSLNSLGSKCYLFTHICCSDLSHSLQFSACEWLLLDLLSLLLVNLSLPLHFLGCECFLYPYSLSLIDMFLLLCSLECECVLLIYFYLLV